MGRVLSMKKSVAAAFAVLPLPAYAADVAATNDRLIGWTQTLFGEGLAGRLRAAAASETLSPLAMFMDADWVVKTVMLGLGLASVLAWAIWAGKVVQMARAGRRIARGYRTLHTAATLDAAPATQAPLAQMIAAARSERDASVGLPDAGVKERVANEVQRIEAGAARAAQSGVTILGSIGATAPFIGLFGTVWGIMNSFIGIAETGTTNLSVVAPGIAEALLATAIGLVAAIPAVLLYNHLTRLIAAHRARLADAAALVERTLSRDLDRRASLPELGPARLRIVAE
jgi:biopolymer transport protein ExbB